MKYIIFLGLNDKDTQTQLKNDKQCLNECMNLITKYTRGATLSLVKGVWKSDENNHLYVENSIKIELLGIDYNTSLLIAKHLKTHFNQESILIEHEVVNYEFV